MRFRVAAMIAAGFVAGWVVFACPAFAQGENAGQVDQSLRKAQEPPVGQDKTRGRIDFQDENRRPQDENIKIMVHSFKITGDWTMSGQALQDVVAPFTGRELTLAEIRGVAEKVTQFYRSKGYQLSWAYVPAQDVKDGIVEIRVIEGQIGKVLVTGNEHYSAKFILGHIPDVHEREAFNLPGLERGLLVLNEYPGLSVHALLRPGENQGFVDLYLNVQDKFPVLVSFDYDNFGTENVSESRYGATVEVANLFYNGQSASLRAVIGTDEGEVEAFQGAYMIPFPEGLKVQIYASIFDYEVGGPLGILDPLGDGFTVGGLVSYPITREREMIFEVQGGFEMKELDQEMAGITTSNDELRVIIAGMRLDYPGHWSGHWIATAQIRQGLDGFMGGMEDGDLDASRVDVDASFTKLTVLGYRLQKVTPWLYWIGRLQGQISSDHLPISEQMGMGGADSVRGYPPFEYMADKGFAATFEARVKLPFLQGTDAYDMIQVAVFYDYGKGYRNDPLLGELKDQTLKGYGVGVRFAHSRWGSIRADFAWNDEDPIASDLDDQRVWISAVFNVN